MHNTDSPCTFPKCPDNAISYDLMSLSGDKVFLSDTDFAMKRLTTVPTKRYCFRHAKEAQRWLGVTSRESKSLEAGIERSTLGDAVKHEPWWEIFRNGPTTHRHEQNLKLSQMASW